MLTNTELEQKLNESPAERVTPEYMHSRISNVDFTKLTDTVTICNITLDNGYSVRGESACVKPENYNKEIGEKIAYENAFKQLWSLFGFLLAENGTLNK
jgi:hypothetical protein